MFFISYLLLRIYGQFGSPCLANNSIGRVLAEVTLLIRGLTPALSVADLYYFH